MTYPVVVRHPSIQVSPELLDACLFLSGKFLYLRWSPYGYVGEVRRIHASDVFFAESNPAFGWNTKGKVVG